MLVMSVFVKTLAYIYIYMRNWPTKYQLADTFTKGSFTKQSWDTLLVLLQIRTNTCDGKSSPAIVKKTRNNKKQTSELTEGKNLTPSSTLEIGGLSDSDFDHIVSIRMICSLHKHVGSSRFRCLPSQRPQFVSRQR